MLKRKLQVFISSTYLDLKNERQEAVEAILGAGHIPAGMELFKASNKSQLATIKKWINESDVYMLILGGRYGSVEEETGKSYTQLEYEYALEQNIPVFAVVLSDSFLKEKSLSEDLVYEKENKEKYDAFKKVVKTKIVKEINDLKDVRITIYESLRELEEENEFSGWVPVNLLNNNFYENFLIKAKSANDIEKQIKSLEVQLFNVKANQVYEKLKNKDIQINKVYRYKKTFWKKGDLKRDLIRVDLYDIFVELCNEMKNKNLNSIMIRYKLRKIIYSIVINDYYNNRSNNFTYDDLPIYKINLALTKLKNLDLIIGHKKIFLTTYNISDLGQYILLQLC